MQKVTNKRRNGEEFTVLLDDDVEITSKVFLNQRGYPKIWDGKKQHYVHRLVMGAKDGEMVDHINHIKTDCRRENLRICDNSKNQANRSKTKGCYFKGGRWEASITIEGKYVYIGRYDTEEEAREAYVSKHAEAFGEFSPHHKTHKEEVK